ncbi:hypothetical protein [Xanthocytophaga agilis]|nr:hypothetical protein [Xanthocytophaga agilis]
MTKFKVHLIFIGILLSSLECSPSKRESFNIDVLMPLKYTSVPLDILVNFPQNYNGLNIETEGYFIATFEDLAIYKSKFDYYSDSKNKAIWINFNSELNSNLDDTCKKLNRRYVIVRGRFITKSKGHLGNYVGEVDNVYYISSN